jgi:transaldolase
MMNPLIALQQFGQSFWYDNISRSLISSGQLARLVSEDGLRGMTSNPTIFEKAIGESNDYDEEIAELVAREFSLPDICEELMVTDIRSAADVLAAVYETSDGHDGFVSLEVNPKLAYETDEMIAEAERLFAKLERPNCEALIGAETVDTMQETTVKAFRDHGRVAATLETDIDEAERHMESLQQAGIDYSAVMQKLADDGVAKFAESFDALQLALEEKQEELLARGRKA